MSGAQAAPRRAVYRCGMCGGRLRIESPRVVDCASPGCCWSSIGRYRPPGYRLRLALTVPGWSWWTIHNDATARVWWWPYRPAMRLLHRFGLHWHRARPLGGKRCDWCGKLQP